MAKNKEQGVNNKGRSGTGVWGRRFFILVVFAGVFLSCALPSGEDWTEETNRQQSIGAGAVLDLTPFIPAPAAGATPVRSFAAGSFVGIVDWTEGGVVNGSTVTGVFRAETAYRAGVTLYPMEGYTFTGGAGFSYAGETLHPIYGTIGEAAVEIGFGETGNDIWAPSTPSEPAAVNGVNLALYFPPPADNAAPVRSFAGSGFVGIVAWKDTGNGDVPAFEAHEDYTAAVTLHPVKGYTLEGAGAFYYGNPADTLTSTPIEPEGLALEAIAFTGTEAGPWVVKPADITNVALTKSHIPAPKAGGRRQAPLRGPSSWEPWCGRTGTRRPSPGCSRSTQPTRRR